VTLQHFKRETTLGMRKKYIFQILISIIVGLAASTSFADSIEFPEEDLATDTVLPKFDNRTMVKNRYVTTKGRFEINGGMGFNLTEALYNNKSFHFGLGYNLTETHGVQFVGMFLLDGLSGNGEALKRGDGLIPPDKLDASLAPHVEQMYLLDYQFTAWYGKISVTKNSIWNLSIYGLVGAGFISFTDSSTVALNLGFGQKMYLTKNLALKTDLRFHFYQGPNPASKTELLRTGSDPVSSDDLDKILYIPTILQTSLMFIF